MPRCLLFSRSRRELEDSRNNCHQKRGQEITHHRTPALIVLLLRGVYYDGFWNYYLFFILQKRRPNFQNGEERTQMRWGFARCRIADSYD